MWGVMSGFVVIVLLVGGIIAIAQGTSSGSAGAQAAYSVAFKLASVDAGHALSGESDPVIAPYRAVLRRLGRACGASTQISLGNMAVRTQKILRANGTNMSLLSVLRSAAIWAGPGGNCLPAFVDVAEGL